MSEPTLPMPSPDREQSTHAVEAPGKPPRRRRRWTKWLIALVLLLGLLVGADRIALAVAESQLADRIKSSQQLSQKPGVSIDGFPFLTQVASRDFGHATVDIHDFPANDVTITDLHADLRGVHVNSGFSAATADTLVATARISYTDLAKALASKLTVEGAQVGTVQLSSAGGGQLKAVYELLGIEVSAIIEVTLAGPNTLEFKSVSFDVPLAGVIKPHSFDQTYDLGTLPLGMKLTQLTFGASAVEVTAAGSHVNLSKNSATLG